MTVPTSSPDVPESILDKLRKLKLHADSARKIGSVAEAEAFAGKITELLLKYNLDMADVPTADTAAEKDPIVRKAMDMDASGVKFRRARVAWQEDLAEAVAKANLCQSFHLSRSNIMIFVGKTSNVQVAEWLFACLARDLEYSADKAYVSFYYECIEKDGNPFRARGYRASWITGAVIAISKRLEATLAAFKADPNAKALVLASDSAVSKWVEDNMSVTLASDLTHRLTNGDGYYDGKKYGSAVSLDRRPAGSAPSPSLPKALPPR